MIKNKKEYFDKSLALSIDSRCPVIEQCQRRADTLALFNNVELNNAQKFASLREPIIDTIGQGASLIGGSNNFITSNLCPEVSLFESELSYYPNQPVTKAQYDKYMSPQSEILETGHYSECAEYCEYRRCVAQINDLEHENKTINYLKKHHQWVIGTMVAVLGLAIALFT